MNPIGMDEPLAVSIKEAKRHLGGIHTATIYRLIDRGELEKRKVGTRTLITMASIKALLGMDRDQSVGINKVEWRII